MLRAIRHAKACSIRRLVDFQRVHDLFSGHAGASHSPDELARIVLVAALVCDMTLTLLLKALKRHCRSHA